MKSTFDKYIERIKKIYDGHGKNTVIMTWAGVDQVARESRDIGYEEGAKNQAILDAEEISKAKRVKDKVRLAWAGETLKKLK